MVKTLILFLVIAPLTLFAQTKPKILIISDIDDTIKVSHVISYKSWNPSVLFRTWDSNTPFSGMASLYQLILNENPGINKVAYLSNAPSKNTAIDYLQTSHENFLKNNNFPQGQLILRDVIFDSDHKIKSIRKLVAENKPDLVIMVGDNGENDINTYQQARQELDSQRIHNLIYIHQLYSSKDENEVGKLVLPGQTGYATSVEVSLDLKQKGLLSDQAMSWMFEKVIPHILSMRYNFFDILSSISFPAFKKCDDFRWIWPVEKNAALREYKEYVTETCR